VASRRGVTRASEVSEISDVITVNMHDAKIRLSGLVRAVEERNETVVLCRDGKEAEIRRRVERRGLRDLLVDPRFGVEFTAGDEPAEPLTDDEWPDSAR
jgi:hypothetical protein